MIDSNVFAEESLMDIKRVGVIGAGTMGNGIAHVFARGGYSVVLCDVEQRFLEASGSREASRRPGGTFL